MHGIYIVREILLNSSSFLAIPDQPTCYEMRYAHDPKFMFDSEQIHTEHKCQFIRNNSVSQPGAQATCMRPYALDWAAWVRP